MVRACAAVAMAVGVVLGVAGWAWAGGAGGAGGGGVRTRHVLIIGVDGMRPDAMLVANAPNIDGLIAAGAYSGEGMAEDITISGPCWSSMLTGVHRSKHGVTGNSFAGSNFDQYPHFFERLEGLCVARTVSIVNWAPINTSILRNRADTVLTGGPDALVADRAVAVLGSQTPDVLFVAFDEVDGAGHAFGFHPTRTQYVAKIEQTDGHIGRILSAVRTRPTAAGEDWLVILTADHGGTIDGSHGRDIPEHRLVPFIVSGPGSAAGTTIVPGPELVDVPATALAFLGLAVDPAWGWDGRAVGLNMGGVTSAAFACVSPPPPPPAPVGACCVRTGACVSVTSGVCAEQRGVWRGLGVACAAAGCAVQTVVFAESFDGLTLGPSVQETPAGAAVWTMSGPAGWSVDNAGLPTGGMPEWRGWAFASPSWWSTVAVDQGRAGFTKARGAVAVADPDEWFDLSTGAGTYNTRLTTAAIPLAGIAAGTAHLVMDSSWVPEGAQRALAQVSFDGGPASTILDWRSVDGPNYKAEARNETVVVALNNPAGAQAARVTLSVLDAGNNWWWAVDNVEVVGAGTPPRRLVFAEDFDGLTLGASVQEVPAGAAVWTGAGPAGWSVDNSGLPGGGMPEWRGWAFASPAWWSTVAGDQGRAGFTRARGAIAVADPDEWFDLSPGAGTYNTRLRTPLIALGASPSRVEVAFDSSWRAEGAQRAELAAEYFDGSGAALGPARVVLDWRSTAGANFKADATNEGVVVGLPHVSGAAGVRLRFSLLDAGNNWWWGVDNVVVTASACVADASGNGTVSIDDVFVFLNLWFTGSPTTDVNGGGVSIDDLFVFLNRWFAGC